MMIRGQDGHDQRYLHMEPGVKPGQEVNAGDQIGRLYDDGDNSHYTLRYTKTVRVDL